MNQEYDVKDNGKNGLDEAEALVALLFGGYNDKFQRKLWERLGPDRILPGYLGSANIPLIKRACHFIVEGGSVEWWMQWVSDQFEFGFFATEGGTCHYGTFQIAAVSAVAKYAKERRLWDLFNRLTEWLNSALSFFALFSCAGGVDVPERERATNALTVQQVGMRHQGLSSSVASAIVATWLCQPVDMKKITRQPYYWPARIFCACSISLGKDESAAVMRFISTGDIHAMPSMMSAYLDKFRININLKLVKWVNGIATAFARKKGDRFNSNGSPSYVSTAMTKPVCAGRLSIEPNRDPHPATCEVEETDSRWSATVRHEASPESVPFQLVMDNPALGAKLFRVNIPILGRMEIVKC